MDQAPEHSLNVAFHRSHERVLGQVVDEALKARNRSALPGRKL